MTAALTFALNATIELIVVLPDAIAAAAANDGRRSAVELTPSDSAVYSLQPMPGSS